MTSDNEDKNAHTISRRAFCGISLGMATTWTLGATQIPSRNKLPNMVMLVLDTVRADRMSLYGHVRHNSRHIEDLADISTVYHEARSPSSWTLPSHASLFTGLYPFEHGSHRYRATASWDFRVTYAKRLSVDLPTLAEILSKNGYRTGCFSANTIYISNRYRMLRGFDTIYTRNARAPRIMSRVKEWLDDIGDTPFFLFINLMDGHMPYNTDPVPGIFENDPPRSSSHQRRLYNLFRANRLSTVTDELRQTVFDQYDLGIANADLAVHDLIQTLKEHRHFDDTALVLTSDHGEYFGEHDLVGHSKDIYEGGVHVPLLVHLPGQNERNDIHEMVSIVHTPSMLAECMLDTLRSACSPLLTHRTGGRVIAANRYARAGEYTCANWGDRFKRIRAALYTWPYKYIHSSDEKHELYNIEIDRDENHNLYAEQNETARAMQRELLSFWHLGDDDAEAFSADELEPLTPQEEEEMRALGYLD